MSIDDVKSFLSSRLRGRASQLGVQELTDETSLTDTGLVDSFGLLELVMELQNEFAVDIDLSDSDPSVFTTFGGLAELVCRAD